MWFARRQFIGSLVSLAAVPLTRALGLAWSPKVQSKLPVPTKPQGDLPSVPRFEYFAMISENLGQGCYLAKWVVPDGPSSWKDGTFHVWKDGSFYVYHSKISEANGRDVPIGKVVRVYGNRFQWNLTN